MTNESHAFFEAVTPPVGGSSALTEDLYETAAPFHVLAAQFRARIAQLRLLLARADRAESNVDIYAKFERFHQTFGALERELGVLTTAAQAVTDAAYQLDRYALEAQAAFSAELAPAPGPDA